MGWGIALALSSVGLVHSLWRLRDLEHKRIADWTGHDIGNIVYWFGWSVGWIISLIKTFE